MPSIPTLVPESIPRWLGRLWRGTWGERLWRAFVILVGALVLVAIVAASPGFFVATLIGLILSTIFSDNVRQLWSDIWNRDFWTFKT